MSAITAGRNSNAGCNMTVKSGERIYVETPMFSGWAIVQGLVGDPRELYPIAIELEEGDSDGHKYKRVGKDDIKVSHEKG
jgi:hypothetical protein